MIQQINHFPLKLRALRMLHRLNQQQLAAKTGIHRNLIVEYERGRAMPAPEQLKSLEAAFGIEFNADTESAFATLAPELGQEAGYA